MRHDDAVRLRHALDAARKALSFTEGRSRTDLDRDEQLALALIRLLEVIGEAANAVSPELRSSCPSIPWRLMIALRNRLIHRYFDLDLDVVWRTVVDDLPGLAAELRRIVPPEEG